MTEKRKKVTQETVRITYRKIQIIHTKYAYSLKTNTERYKNDLLLLRTLKNSKGLFICT